MTAPPRLQPFSHVPLNWAPKEAQAIRDWLVVLHNGVWNIYGERLLSRASMMRRPDGISLLRSRVPWANTDRSEWDDVRRRALDPRQLVRAGGAVPHSGRRELSVRRGASIDDTFMGRVVAGHPLYQGGPR